jgi:hypothetical protein
MTFGFGYALIEDNFDLTKNSDIFGEQQDLIVVTMENNYVSHRNINTIDDISKHRNIKALIIKTITNNTLSEARTVLNNLLDQGVAIFVIGDNLQDNIVLEIVQRNSVKSYKTEDDGLILIANGIVQLTNETYKSIDILCYNPKKQDIIGHISDLVSSEQFFKEDFVEVDQENTIHSMYWGWAGDTKQIIILDSPYGNYSHTIVPKILKNNPSQDWDYWAFEIRNECIPGKVAYGSSWMSSYNDTKVYDYRPRPYYLNDYKPDTYLGPDIQYGVTISTQGVSMSWTYQTHKTTTDNYSSTPNKFIRHRVNYMNFQPTKSQTHNWRPGMILQVQLEHLPPPSQGSGSSIGLSFENTLRWDSGWTFKTRSFSRIVTWDYVWR